MGTWFWLNIPLALLFVCCWAGIPLWLTLTRWNAGARRKARRSRGRSRGRSGPCGRRGAVGADGRAGDRQPGVCRTCRSAGPLSLPANGPATASPLLITTDQTRPGPAGSAVSRHAVIEADTVPVAGRLRSTFAPGPAAAGRASRSGRASSVRGRGVPGYRTAWCKRSRGRGGSRRWRPARRRVTSARASGQPRGTPARSAAIRGADRIEEGAQHHAMQPPGLPACRLVG